MCSCEMDKKSTMEVTTIMEVTTFKINTNISPLSFAGRDAQVESDFTSKQSGFIKRQSGVDDDGNYVVVVYWASTADADASMNKFMADESVADYGQMIDAATMKMSRYQMDKAFKASESQFVEIMSFDVNPNTDLEKFNATNQRVETDFTGKRKGFMQRLTGVNDEGRQVVAVYWENKTSSDASLKPFMEAPVSKEFMQEMNQASMTMGRYKFLNIELNYKEKVVALLNSFNTGDPSPISYINPEKYIQHNLSVGDGLEGFGEVMKHAPPQGFKANVVRAFQDGDYVFTHTEYDFFGPKIGFDVFRFENGLIVEHWDNLLEVAKETASGRSQTDGATDITDKDKTEANKKIVKEFYESVILGGQFERMGEFFNEDHYIQHNPMLPDGVSEFLNGVKKMQEDGITMKVNKLHMVLGEGNYVFCMSEGTLADKPYAYYDLFRVENGKLAEHWDVMAEIPPKSEWKNNNGKF